MAIHSMAAILDQIHFQARQASGLKGADHADEANAGGTPFSALLADTLRDINQAQNSAKNLSQAFMSGAADIGLNDVMVSLQKSSLMLNMGIQVRNKMVSAYQEIMSMSL